MENTTGNAILKLQSNFYHIEPYNNITYYKPIEGERLPKDYTNILRADID